MAGFRRSVRARNNKNKINMEMSVKGIVLVLIVIVVICMIILCIKKIKTNREIAIARKENEERIQQILFLEENTKEQIEEKEENVIKEDTIIKITTVGDILCETQMCDDAYQGENNYDFSHMFEQIKQYTMNADLTLGLLETNFVEDELVSGNYKYNAPKQLAEELKNIGIDILNMANNHSLDYGYKGVEDTINCLSKIGIETVGTYKQEEIVEKVLIKEVKGIKLAFLSYTYGTNQKAEEKCVNYIDKETMKSDIAYAKEKGAEYVFVHMHWGEVNSSKATEEQKELANYLFDNGADFILGSHPASLQPMEVRTNDVGKNIFIAYSTGNFISASSYTNSNIEMILDIEITKSGETGETRLSKVTYTPVYFCDNGKNAENRFQLLDMGKIIREYENGNTQNINKSLYNKVKQAREKIDELIGKE